MRLATYNIFEGARDTYALLIEFARRSDIDILCLQEANDWHNSQIGDRSRLEDFAARTGLRYYAFGDSNTACKLITYSRFPITKSKIHTEGFHHCAVQTTIETPNGAVELINTHLNPFDEDKRLAEVKYITAIGKDAILLGDMNSLSRQDNYPDSLMSRLHDLQNERYGTDELRYDVTDYLALQGFIDVAVMHGAHRPTFPALTGLEQFQHPTRFDYVFMPWELAMTVKDIKVIADPETSLISDHYPVVVDLLPHAVGLAAPQALLPETISVT